MDIESQLSDQKPLIPRLARAAARYRARIRAWLLQRHISLPPELREDIKINNALHCFQQRWPKPDDILQDADSPVFILSAGWRSGSTLLQRLVVSSREVMVWGEPLGDAGIIAHLAHPVTAIGLDWPRERFFDYQRGLADLSSQWIANVTPQMEHLRAAHRAFFRAWLGTPAQAVFGVPRWGLKEVRLTIHHARYFKWLFPNARFLFIYRNLFDAFSSWKGNRWGSNWPGYYSKSPIAFARHWRYLLEGFLHAHHEVDGMVIKYEDLVSGKIDLRSLADHIGVSDLDASQLDRTIGTPLARHRKAKKALNRYEHMVLRTIGGDLLNQLGYR